MRPGWTWPGVNPPTNPKYSGQRWTLESVWSLPRKNGAEGSWLSNYGMFLILSSCMCSEELTKDSRDNDSNLFLPLLELIDGQFVNFEFSYLGTGEVWVSVLSVDAVGRIFILSSNAWERGIPLNAEIQTRELKRSKSSSRGLKISRPKSLPVSSTSEPVYEYFVFVMTGKQNKAKGGSINRSVLNVVLDFVEESKRFVSRAPERPQKRGREQRVQRRPPRG